MVVTQGAAHNTLVLPHGVHAGPELDLLQSFELRQRGVAVQLSQTSQRVVAFLAVHERALQRPYVSGSLWPDVSDARADGSLRSAIWRLREIGLDLVIGQNGSIGLNPVIRIDIADLIRRARRLADLSAADLGAVAYGYQCELLPDWYDDWIVDWRERWRQIRFHALEEVATRLIGSGDFGLAIEIGLAAVRAEPMRESAHCVVIRAHLAEGNRQEALRQYRAYEQLLHVELGIEPSPTVESLIEPVIHR